MVEGVPTCVDDWHPGLEAQLRPVPITELAQGNLSEDTLINFQVCWLPMRLVGPDFPVGCFSMAVTRMFPAIAMLPPRTFGNT